MADWFKLEPEWAAEHVKMVPEDEGPLSGFEILAAENLRHKLLTGEFTVIVNEATGDVFAGSREECEERIREDAA